MQSVGSAAVQRVFGAMIGATGSGEGAASKLADDSATALEFVNGGASQATTDPAATTQALNTALAPKGLVALEYAKANDQNGYVVTNATADQYGLVTPIRTSSRAGQEGLPPYVDTVHFGCHTACARR
jgi:hypothetical protein